MIALWASLALSGEVSGTVLDDAGEPVQGALVLAYDRRLAYGSDYTGVDGAYRILDLAKGPYRIRVLPPAGANLIEQFLPSGASLCDGSSYFVKRNDARVVEPVSLLPGARATGRILGPTGAPVVAEVIARSVSGVSGVISRSGVSDVDGWFEIQGIPVSLDGAEWRFEVEAEGYPDQFLGASFSEDLGEIWSLSTDSLTDLGQHALRPGGALAGTAQGPSGPISSGSVYAVTTGRTLSGVIEAGEWRVDGLAPGEALLWAVVPGLATTYWPDLGVPGPLVAVEDGVEVQEVALTLQAEAWFSGQLQGAEDFTGTTITALREDQTVAVSGEVEADGRFEVRGLAEGRWHLQVHPDESLDLVDGSLRDDRGRERVFEVASGEQLDLGPVPLLTGATISGVAWDRGTDERVYGAWVYLENVDTARIRLVQSERNGRFRSSGLEAGTYRMWAEYQSYCDADPDWVTRYYPDQRNPALGGSFPLAPGQITSWHLGLAPDADHDDMDDNWEANHGLDPARDDGAEDLDGDGFVNLDEYLLGTDPSSMPQGSCGGGDDGAAWIVVAMPLLWRRRRAEPERVA